MKAITFLLHTQQPLLVTSLQGDPNSDVSFSYIPGSMIRGMLIGRYLQRHGLHSTDDILDDSKFPDVRRLFFDGSSRYLNAYLYTNNSNKEKKRTLPIPLSWFRRKVDDISKLEEITAFDFSYEQPEEDISPKSLDASFCTVDDKKVKLCQEKRRINIHNKRDRQRGRGIEGSGAVFRYETLDAGQTFQAVILFDEADDVEKIKPLLEPNELWLGGSQSAGYGHIKVDRVEEPEIWHELGTELADPEERCDREILRITLLSDLILQDEWGQYVVIPPTDSGSNEISQAINPLTELLEKLLEVKLEPQSSYTTGLIVGGFNRKWGLPLPQVPALAAGSVFVFNHNGQLNTDRILHLENQGIGERRVDGFGRVAVNWLEDYPRFTASLLDSETDWTEPQLEPNSEDSQIAKQMAKRLLEQKLERLLLEKVNSIQLNPNKMTNSQLSRLMIVARQAIAEENQNPVLELLNNLPKNAETQFENTKVNGKALKKQIGEWLDNPSNWLDLRNLDVRVASESVPPEQVDRLKLEYTLRLIMAIAKQATKESKNE
jgi:CRISPR-associated protein Csx10